MRVRDLEFQVRRVVKAPEKQAKLLPVSDGKAALGVGGRRGNLRLGELDARLCDRSMGARIGDLAGKTGRRGEHRRNTRGLRQQTHKEDKQTQMHGREWMERADRKSNQNGRLVARGHSIQHSLFGCNGRPLAAAEPTRRQRNAIEPVIAGKRHTSLSGPGQCARA